MAGVPSWFLRQIVDKMKFLLNVFDVEKYGTLDGRNLLLSLLGSIKRAFLVIYMHMKGVSLSVLPLLLSIRVYSRSSVRMVALRQKGSCLGFFECTPHPKT